MDLKAWNQEFINFSIENLSAGWHSVYLTLDEENKINESDEENNELVIGILVERENITSNISDLIIANLTPSKINPIVGETITFFVTTKNTGTANASSSYTGYYADNSLTGNSSVPSLAINASYNSNFTYKCVASVWHTIKAKADNWGFVSESNEGNNEKTYNIFCNASYF